MKVRSLWTSISRDHQQTEEGVENELKWHKFHLFYIKYSQGVSNSDKAYNVKNSCCINVLQKLDNIYNKSRFSFKCYHWSVCTNCTFLMIDWGMIRSCYDKCCHLKVYGKCLSIFNVCTYFCGSYYAHILYLLCFARIEKTFAVIWQKQNYMCATINAHWAHQCLHTCAQQSMHTEPTSVCISDIYIIVHQFVSVSGIELRFLSVVSIRSCHTTRQATPLWLCGKTVCLYNARSRQRKR